MWNELDPYGHLDLHTKKLPLLDKSIIGTELCWRWFGGGSGNNNYEHPVDKARREYRESQESGFNNWKENYSGRTVPIENMGTWKLHHDGTNWNKTEERTDRNTDLLQEQYGDEAWLKKVYRDELNKEADAEGLAYWKKQLKTKSNYQVLRDIRTAGGVGQGTGKSYDGYYSIGDGQGSSYFRYDKNRDDKGIPDKEMYVRFSQEGGEHTSWERPTFEVFYTEEPMETGKTGSWHQNWYPKGTTRGGTVHLGKPTTEHEMKQAFLNATAGWSSEAWKHRRKGEPDFNKLSTFIKNEFSQHRYWKGTFMGYGDDNAELDKYLHIPNALKEVDREYNQKKNDEVRKYNDSNKKYNNQAAAKNKAYDDAIAIANKTKRQGSPGTSNTNYLDRRAEFSSIIKDLENAGISTNDITQLKGEMGKAYEDFYINKKINKWEKTPAEDGSEHDPTKSRGDEPPFGIFDPAYYRAIMHGAVETEWTDAGNDHFFANNDRGNLDITEKYGTVDNYAHAHYVLGGKSVRGNRSELYQMADQYLDDPDGEIQDERIYDMAAKLKGTSKSDVALQQARDDMLSIDPLSATERILGVDAQGNDTGGGSEEVKALWNEAQIAKENNDENNYWVQQSKEKFLDIDNPDEFLLLFQTSDRQEDIDLEQQLLDSGNYGISELEAAATTVWGEEGPVNLKRFGALTQDVLNQTIAEMKKAKAKEETLQVMKGFGTFGEIMDVNKSLTESILGDSGVGGILSFTSGGAADDRLSKNIENLSGVKNNVTYNWQKWFDESLAKRYYSDDGDALLENEDGTISLDYVTEKDGVEIREPQTILPEFAKVFVDEYLTERFDTSRSMDEFRDYINVKDEHQNPFQTQTLINAVKSEAEFHANSKLNAISNTTERDFDHEFYFNPIAGGGNVYDPDRTDRYASQKAIVNADWEAAKNGDVYWARQAYRYGIPSWSEANKEEFAKIHYEVKGHLHRDENGELKPFDPAENIWDLGTIRKFIHETVTPEMIEVAEQQDNLPFASFVTPEEYTDELLKGVMPDSVEWKEILEKFDLEEFAGDFDELKKYIIDVLRTSSAHEIRENIKYLNERRRRPTQQILGLTYIEREEDYKDEMSEPETQLYKHFQDSGYQGTEDQFYESFFPDLERSEQVLLTKGGKNQALEQWGFDLTASDDPWTALSELEGYFGSDEKEKDDDEEYEKKVKGYFTLDPEEEEWKPKKQPGETVFDEFTGFFKGL